MSIHQISTYLKFANLQMASEALLDRLNLQNDNLASVLIGGNGRSSKFMDTQATSFASDWEVAAHQSNTATGFSGTLFRCRVTDTARGLVAGELTLSFRSTEFIDDAVRDNQATNAMEIKEKGWAFGQIADMEDWYAKLRVDPALLAGKSFNVTGYSLGGHLATAFALLRDAEAGPGNSVPLPNPILQTYTFNGAGVGTVSAGTTVGLVLQQFQQWRAAPAMMQFQNAELNAVYQSLLGKYTGAIRVAQSDYTRVLQTGAPPAEQAELVEALGRIDKIIHERDRVAGLKAGSAPPAPTGTVDQASLGYQLAVLRASQSTQAVSLFAGISSIVFGRRPPGPFLFGNFTDLYGTGVQAVANSQFHYGKSQAVFIEDQPLVRGSIASDVVLETLKAQDVKFLVNGYDQNDFGDTHSLVLMVDSLNVMNLFATLAPGATQTQIEQVLKDASNGKGVSYVDAAKQGISDGNLLDTTLDRLRNLIRGGEQKETLDQQQQDMWATARTCSYLAGLEMLTGFEGCTGYSATIDT